MTGHRESLPVAPLRLASRGVTKTQYYTATTLDGFIADEQNSLDWLFLVDRGTDPGSEFEQFMADVGAMAMGATTYEWSLANHGPHEDPEKWRADYGERPCWVFTHRDLPAIPERTSSSYRATSGPCTRR